GFNVGISLHLVPQFNEKDPDVFFSLFEWVAESRSWEDAERTLLLQCTFTGRAQEAYSVLTVTDDKVYAKVKTAVLSDLVAQFNRWCSASQVTTFEGLSDLVILEQFKSSLPESVVTCSN
ncbi:hypothetical protein LDENG_00210370, partial [Lucifuga dentata]